MTAVLEAINGFVWGIPALILILGVGLYLSIVTGFAQLTFFPRAIRNFFASFRKKTGKNEVSAYQALCTALAATVGTGNLVGVAGAIAIGGPGTVFWMWVCAILGMVTKYAEATLAVRYRQKNQAGEYVGGPMYMIQNGLGHRSRWLAGVYCFFGVVAAFGVGNATQINAMIGGFRYVLETFHIEPVRYMNLFLGVTVSILIVCVLMGGAKRIGTVTQYLVPVVSIGYLIFGIGILIVRHNRLPEALGQIVQGAFTPSAVTGGILGSAFTALRIGASRGVFTNEAGMGTASIAHASANVNHPAEQGLMGIIEVFIDTIVICTITALAILCSGVEIPYGEDVGIALTSHAFSAVYGRWICVFIAFSLCCFAFATVLGWGLYGARCAQFLFGDNVWKPFVFLQAIAVIVGAVLKTGTVWMLSETVNGLMAIPNLIALAMLSPELIALTNEYRKHIKAHN